eukprot:scaffold6377_cov125-Isochrysis_galbana.AAC.5
MDGRFLLLVLGFAPCPVLPFAREKARLGEVGEVEEGTEGRNPSAGLEAPFPNGEATGPAEHSISYWDNRCLNRIPDRSTETKCAEGDVRLNQSRRCRHTSPRSRQWVVLQ